LRLGVFALSFLCRRCYASMAIGNAKSGLSHDVLIVGGGIVGATLACALADEQLRIAILEHNPPPPPPSADYALRVSAIAPSSRTIFESIGTWSAMQPQRICPVEEMHVWDAGGSGAIHFDSADLGEPCLAYIIENDAMLAALWQRIAQCKHIDPYCPSAVAGIEVHDTHVTVDVGAGVRLSARLLVGADGPRSSVRTRMGISTTRWDYAQRAIVAMVAVERPRRHTAWQRFLPTGPLAFLPLPDGRYSIVWSVDAAQADHLLARDDAAFMEALQAAFGERLGRIRASSARLAFALQRAHAQRYVAPRVALIGDAAHTVHPLAGQGVNLGLLDAAVLAEVLLDAHSAGRDIGALTTVRRYERWRKGDNLAMLVLTDGLKRLFGSSVSALQQVRNAGLDLTNAVMPLKRTLMRRAAGLAGDLPKLARPPHG
jgi:2-polyprenylphenol 6-hydroxylase